MNVSKGNAIKSQKFFSTLKPTLSLVKSTKSKKGKPGESLRNRNKTNSKKAS